ncbi:divergent PAP2 family protein [Catonella morbi ATCC 51271]|jgi:hypothetical protein|uniref:Divergent PAP2 family protein n=1 Tax=Catonella morbi ATCC 51271 TaxID=592026 RepID=V2ZAH6_9FIRM|nr:divergent PAP2 family protein [Catonella morbi]ESL03940.1 divergent PAP2 family protein [Catonella morbi ATCC 51271]
MDYISQILTNKIIIAGLVSWATAQCLKLLIYRIVNKKLDFERLFGDGGMPSSHSATVTSVALMTGLTTGFDSPVFGIAFILAIVVMHDASGVRLETGKQAKVINELVKIFEDLGKSTLSPQEKLKEFVGHTHMQVLAGFCLGIIVTILYFCL